MNKFCSAPYIYTLEITSACNANCVGCGNVFPHDGTHITANACRTLLEKISHPEMFRVTGGEPTLSPEFAEIMRLLDAQGKPLVVFTNGAWEHPHAMIKILKGCENLDGILVSLHGHSAPAHKAFTRTDYFSRILANIRRASEVGITVNTNTILTHKNIHHMEEIVDLANEAGADVVAFSRYYGSPIRDLTDLSAKQYRDAIDRVAYLRAEGKRVKFNNNIPLCLGGKLTQACPAADTHCTISPACTVRLCNHDAQDIGNILETPIEDMWQSDYVRWWRDQIPDMCRECVAFELCKGGCKANAQANGLSSDPLARRPYQTMPALPTPLHHSLYSERFPKATFSLYEEDFGYLLINRSQILKVTHEAAPLLHTLEQGNKSLADIYTLFGQASVNFIGLLYDQRMVELR